MNDLQYIFTICSLCSLDATKGGFSVGRWADADMKPKGDPEIVHWFLDIPKPTHEEILAHWELVKNKYVNPFAKPKSIFSVREFRARFTQDEQIAIRSASMTDMEVGIVYDDFQSAQFIDVHDPAVTQGIDLYVTKGLLAPGRKAELLKPEPIPEEPATAA